MTDAISPNPTGIANGFGILISLPPTVTSLQEMTAIPTGGKIYQTFTRNQLNELMSDYGKLLISIWLDGGWVKGDDIGLDDILAQARRQASGIDFGRPQHHGGQKRKTTRLPNAAFPETQLNYPWESCITLSNDWGWVPNAPFKSSQKVINILSEITAKGGCLLLGVGPNPGRCHRRRSGQASARSGRMVAGKRQSHLQYPNHSCLSGRTHMVHCRQGRTDTLCHLCIARRRNTAGSHRMDRKSSERQNENAERKQECEIYLRW